MTDFWTWCQCGHLMLLHDVEDMDSSNPTCCVDGCTQQGCRQVATAQELN